MSKSAIILMTPCWTCCLTQDFGLLVTCVEGYNLDSSASAEVVEEGGRKSKRLRSKCTNGVCDGRRSARLALLTFDQKRPSRVIGGHIFRRLRQNYYPSSPWLRLLRALPHGHNSL